MTEPRDSATLEAVDFSRYEGHTPGPWYGEEEDEDEILICTTTDPDSLIASIWIGGPHDVRANARLIADAPRFLATLTTLTARVAELEGEIGRKDELLAAIRKETGNGSAVAFGALRRVRTMIDADAARAALSPAAKEDGL